MTDPIKMTDTLPPPEPIKMAIDALTCAQQFIRNGVELGYIRMPDADCPARPSPEWYQDKIKQTLNDDFTIGAASPAERQKYDDVLVPFVAAMRQELHANSSKGDRPGWLKMDANTALLEVYWHAAKLSAAVKNNDGPAIQEHSADVANMAMMVLDVCGGLILERKQ